MKSRRAFLRDGSLAALAAAVPLRARAFAAAPLVNTPIDTAPRAGDPALRDLAFRALDAAKGAGATYADVRLTLTRKRSFLNQQPPIDRESIAVGVRAIANGAWGFASGPVWTADEMARLGRAAATLGKANRWRHAAAVELGDRPVAAVGEWRMPVARDPFDVPIDETLDCLRALEQYASLLPNVNAACNVVFQRQDRTFASTDGAMCSQTVYTTFDEGSLFLVMYTDPKTGMSTGRSAAYVSPRGAGYEALRYGKIEAMIPELAEEARLQIGAEPVVNGRYDVVLDGYAMAPILSQSIGIALEVDRALGLEANAGGTTYLGLRDDLLGPTFDVPLGPPALTVTADRSRVGGAATVRWDDDGIAPSEARLVTEGRVTDYQTDREHAASLAEWYRRSGAPARSRGCAASGSATDTPLVHPGNIEMHAAANGPSFEELIAGVKDGIALKGGYCMMDHQQLTGQGFAEVAYRIKNGKLAGQVRQGAGYRIRSPEFWQGLAAVGGPETTLTRGMPTRKGEPEQYTVHSVTAPAAMVRNVAVLDVFASQRSTSGPGL